MPTLESQNGKIQVFKELMAEIITGFQNFRFLSSGDRKILLSDFGREGDDGYSLFFNQLSEGHRVLTMLYSIAYGLIGLLCEDQEHERFFRPLLSKWFGKGELRVNKISNRQGTGDAYVVANYAKEVQVAVRELRSGRGRRW